MNIFNYKIVGTGSSGNGYLVFIPNIGKVAIECGIRLEEFLKIAGIPDCYWISHRHLDHCKYEKQYSSICGKVNFKNTFNLEHGTIKKPCENKGFYVDFNGNNRFLFATDFYDFEKVPVNKVSRGLAMVECSHDFMTYDEMAQSDNKIDRLKAMQWENHACETQTIALLSHFLSYDFKGDIVLLHRSKDAYDTRHISEAYIRKFFKNANVVWA